MYGRCQQSASNERLGVCHCEEIARLRAKGLAEVGRSIGGLCCEYNAFSCAQRTTTRRMEYISKNCLINMVRFNFYFFLILKNLLFFYYYIILNNITFVGGGGGRICVVVVWCFDAVVDVDDVKFEKNAPSFF